MNFLNKMERKFGRYAISNLSVYLIIAYAIGYMLQFINPYIALYLSLDPYQILHGQVWRIFTWILIPPGEIDLFTLIMLYFYYSIGTTLERTWGEFYYNLYLFMGMFFTVLGSFLIYFINPGLSVDEYALIALSFSTYYVNMSIFLGFAMTYPNMQVLLMFIIPIKIKWMGIVYGALLLSSFLQSNYIGKIIIGASLLNFVVFFLLTNKNLKRMSPREVRRRNAYHREVKKARPMSVAKHKCAICGKNSEEYPDAEFRFCSKCNGNYEYCQDHLFTHTHVK